MESTAPVPSGQPASAAAARPSVAGGGGLRVYKPSQGKMTRLGTFVGAGVLIAWGALFLRDRLDVYSGPGFWRLFVTSGIPLLFAVACGVAAWWVVYVSRKSGDFMIATEGEMKKVNWTSRREIIGSTKVVILITVLLALVMFVVDVLFQLLFTWVGVLKAA